MKRLLIAMSAAAMMSLCAKADAEPTLLGGMDFESGYTAGDPIVPGASDPGSASLFFWAGSNGESYVAEEETDMAGVSNKFLKVDTTTNVLVRQTAVLNASAVAPVDIGDGDITVSAKVQFTAMDADSAPTPSEGDKLIVWARAPEEGAENQDIKLMVTSKGTSQGEILTNETDFVVLPDTWYNLAIVAVKSGGSLTESSSFTVKIAAAGSEPAAVTVGGVAATFKSLLPEGDPAAQTIASIGFKGTGAVDDIVFEKNAAAPDVTVTVTCTAGYEVYLDEECEDEYEDPISVKAGQNAIVYVLDLNGTYTVSCEGGSVGTWDSENKVWPVSYPTDAQHLEVTMDITVADDGKTAITASDVTLSYEQATYYEGIEYPTVTVTVNKTTLVKDTDYTESWVPDTITSAGGTFTVTVAGKGDYKGSVVKTVTITPAGGDKPQVGGNDCATGEAFVAAATSGTVNTLPSGWTVDGNAVKDGTGTTFATFPEFYTVSLTGTTLTLELNNKALDTAGNMTAVTVGESFGLSVSASNTKLYYGLASCATVGGEYTAPTSLMKGTGDALAIPAAKSGDQRFYKLYVTDVVEAGQEVLNVD